MSKIREALSRAKQAREAGTIAGPNHAEPTLGRLVRRSSSVPTVHSLQVDTIEAALAQLDAADPNRAAQDDRHVEIDMAALRDAGLLATEGQERLVAEEYRQIKRPLLANAAGKSGVELPRASLIMVSSALPNEGKTFTCINLALSIARERDWRVLLVDGDVANPNLTRLFGLVEEPGLLDLARDPVLAIDQCVVPTTVAGLSVMPAGEPHNDATELLGSLRMEAIAQRLSELQPQTIVLFDSPPLLLTTESLAIAAHTGQTVVVVKAGYTTQQDVLQAIGKLDPSRAINLILNQAKASGSLSYGSYYGHRSASESAEASKAHATE